MAVVECFGWAKRGQESKEATHEATAHCSQSQSRISIGTRHMLYLLFFLRSPFSQSRAAACAAPPRHSNCGSLRGIAVSQCRYREVALARPVVVASLRELGRSLAPPHRARFDAWQLGALRHDVIRVSLRDLSIRLRPAEAHARHRFCQQRLEKVEAAVATVAQARRVEAAALEAARPKEAPADLRGERSEEGARYNVEQVCGSDGQNL